MIENDYSFDSGMESGSPSDSLCDPLADIGEIPLEFANNTQYLSRSYIEMPQGKGLWVPQKERSSSATIKVDKDDIRAKRHYVKILKKDGREVKIWECGLCGKEFRFQYTLVRHIPTHTDVRNYQCDICPKAFRQLSTLAQHKATHWNMRPFSCDFCKKSFNRISTLISHKKIHYDEKKHVCPYCGKGFHQKGNLRNHMYTHTNERPYKCEICFKGFNQKSNLVCHKLSTHSKKDHYQCEICNITFAKQTLYTCHMESIHNITVNQIKRQHQPSTFWEDSNDEPQCAIVDDANNILYPLPVSIDKRKMSSNHLNNEDDSSSEIKEPTKFPKADIVAVIDQEPTAAMVNLQKNKQVPFVLFYESGESQPKVCKVVTRRNHYLLIHPTNDDLKYLFEKSGSKPNKYPVVANIIQKDDNEGNLQVLVVPTELPSVDSEVEDNNFVIDVSGNLPGKITLYNDKGEESVVGDEALKFRHIKKETDVLIVPEAKRQCTRKDKGKAAIIYTKTQPNIRATKIKKSLDIAGNSRENDSAMKLSFSNALFTDPLSGSSNTSSRDCSTDSSGYISVSSIKREPKYSIEDDPIEITTKKDTGFETFESKHSATLCTSSRNQDRNDFYMQSGISEFKDFAVQGNEIPNNSMFCSDMSLKACENYMNSQLFQIKDIGMESHHLTQNSNVKKEVDSTETLLGNMDELDASLFMGSDNLKEPLGKYNLDFEGEGFDILGDYSFTDTFLENVNNMPDKKILLIVNEEPTYEMLQLQKKNIVPFALFNKINEHPVICKAIICGKKYFLAHPSKEDLDNYILWNTEIKIIQVPITIIINESRDILGKFSYSTTKLDQTSTETNSVKTIQNKEYMAKNFKKHENRIVKSTKDLVTNKDKFSEVTDLALLDGEELTKYFDSIF